MTAPSTLPRLVDMIEAIDRIRDVIADVSLESFEASWQMQWVSSEHPRSTETEDVSGRGSPDLGSSISRTRRQLAVVFVKSSNWVCARPLESSARRGRRSSGPQCRRGALEGALQDPRRQANRLER